MKKYIFIFTLLSTLLLYSNAITQDASVARSNKGSLIYIGVTDVTGPEIQMLEPAQLAQRGIKIIAEASFITTSGSSISLRGIATDSSGVAQVLVNGQESKLMMTATGAEFSFTALLAIGQNELEVKAIDRYKNSTEFKVSVLREESIIHGKYFALLIANQNYQDPTMNLDNPIRDADSLKKVLIEQYIFDAQNVKTLKDPDRRTILLELAALRTKLTTNDNLLVFYAGHGTWDEGQEQGYWLPRNATMTDQTEWIPNNTIRDNIRGIKTKHTILIADACFSGGIFRSRDVITRPDASVEKTYGMISRRAITSGNLKTVQDKSVFLEILVKRLKENQDRYLTAVKLYANMREEVINNSKNNQTPLYGVISEANDEGGDFIFVRR